MFVVFILLCYIFSHVINRQVCENNMFIREHLKSNLLTKLFSSFVLLFSVFKNVISRLVIGQQLSNLVFYCFFSLKFIMFYDIINLILQINTSMFRQVRMKNLGMHFEIWLWYKTCKMLSFLVLKNNLVAMQLFCQLYYLQSYHQTILMFFFPLFINILNCL